VQEFWQSTLSEFNDEVEAYELRAKKEDYRVALICASIYNSQRTKKDKLVKPEQFMPKQEAKKKQSVNDMLKFAEILTQMKGGIVLRKGTANDDTG